MDQVYFFRRFCDLEIIADAMTYYPGNFISGTDHPGVFFLNYRNFLVDEEITELFAVFHAQRNKTVTLLPLSQDKRERL